MCLNSNILNSMKLEFEKNELVQALLKHQTLRTQKLKRIVLYCYKEIFLFTKKPPLDLFPELSKLTFGSCGIICNFFTKLSGNRY